MPHALLIHGITNGPTSMWRYGVWLEDAGWTVSFHTLLGHGGRPAAPAYTLEAYADDALAAGDFDLVIGHSLGGSTATVAAAKRASFAKRLVLVDPAWRVEPEFLAVGKAMQTHDLSLTLEEIAAEHPAWHPLDHSTKYNEARRCRFDAVIATFDENPSWDLRPQAESLEMSTLLLTAGGDDTVVYPEDARGAVDANPNIVWRVVEGAGHNVHRDEPAMTKALLLAWLEACA